MLLLICKCSYKKTFFIKSILYKINLKPFYFKIANIKEENNEIRLPMS